MSDLDEELLALVDGGGDSPTPKKTSGGGKRKKTVGDSSDSDSDQERGGKTKGHRQQQHKKEKPSAKKRKKARSSDDEEEEEESESSDDDDSSSSSGSDSDDDGGANEEDEDEEGFDDGFDNELMGDEKDRQALMSMTVLEREKILAERQEKRDAWAEKQRIRRLLKESNRQTKQSKSVKTRSASKDKPSRTSRLKELSERRKKTTEKRTTSDKAQEAVSDTKDDSSDYSGDERSYSTRDIPKKDKETKNEPDRPITLSDMNTVRVSRTHLAKWVHHPSFESTVVGCYVRVGLGSTGKDHVYRIAEITKVEDYPRTYTFDNVTTRRSFILHQGKSHRQIRLEYVSNSLFTEAEYQKWLDQLRFSGQSPPTLRSLQAKAEELAKLKAHIWTPEELKYKLAKEEQYSGPRNPQMVKIDLDQKLMIAKADGNTHDIDLWTNELKKLAPHLAKIGAAPQQKINVDSLNRRAMLEQKDNDAAWQQQAKAKEVKVNDPFARRPCQPAPFFNNSKKTLSAPTESQGGQKEEKKKEDDKEKEKEKEQPKMVTPKKSASLIDREDSTSAIHHAIDLDLDIDITAAPTQILPRPTTGTTTASRLSSLSKPKGMY